MHVLKKQLHALAELEVVEKDPGLWIISILKN